MMNKILDTPVIQTPWQHIIVEDILPPEILNAVNAAAKIMSPHIIDGEYSIDLADSIVFGVPAETVDLVSEYADQLLDIHKQVISKFDHMTFTEYGYFSDIRWGASKNQSSSIHDDKANLNKMMTLVIYISPTDDIGTSIYTTANETDYHSTVAWKPNTALLFCPQSNVTWHSFVSGDTPRITLNLYYKGLDPLFLNQDLQNNAVLTQPLDRIKWMLEKFEQNKLVRAYNNVDVTEIFKLFDERLKNEQGIDD